MLRGAEKRKQRMRKPASSKSVTANGNVLFISRPITIQYQKSIEGVKKEHVSFALETGLPLALLNFRLCLSGAGELLWVCGRPAGLLSHQQVVSASRLQRSVDVRLLFCLSIRDSVTGRGLQARQPSQVHGCLCPLQQLLALRREAATESPYQSE